MPLKATEPTSEQQSPSLPSAQESGPSLPFHVAIADAELEIAARNQKRGRRRRRHPDTTNDKSTLQNIDGRGPSSLADPPDTQDRIRHVFRVSTTAHKEAETGMSFFITKAQRAELRRVGYSEEQIREMKPEEAHRALGLIS
jgi:hypothetical protein